METIERISPWFQLLRLFVSTDRKVISILRRLDILRKSLSIFPLDSSLFLLAGCHFSKTFDLLDDLLHSFEIVVLDIFVGHAVVGDFLFERVGVGLNTVSFCVLGGLYYLIKDINL